MQRTLVSRYTFETYEQTILLNCVHDMRKFEKLL